MPWSHLQTNSAFGSTSPQAVAYSSALAAGSLLLAFVAWASNTGTVGVSDPTHGTWSLVPGSLVNGAGSLRSGGWFTVPSAIGGGTPTVTATVTGTPGFFFLTIHEYSGAARLLDAVVAEEGFSANPTSTIWPVAANDLIVGGCFTAGNVTVGTGFTQRVLSSGNVVEEITSHTKAAGSMSVPFVDGGTNDWIISAIALAEGSGIQPGTRTWNFKSWFPGT